MSLTLIFFTTEIFNKPMDINFFRLLQKRTVLVDGRLKKITTIPEDTIDDEAIDEKNFPMDKNSLKVNDPVIFKKKTLILFLLKTLLILNLNL